MCALSRTAHVIALDPRLVHGPKPWFVRVPSVVPHNVRRNKQELSPILGFVQNPCHSAYPLGQSLGVSSSGLLGL
jgi:hypothetical protein